MTKEALVAKVNDLQEGDMKEVEVDGLKILLTKFQGKFHAVGGECPHYGGPLAEGVRVGEHVTCPWHQARFHISTGDLVDPPSLDALTRFETKMEGENVIVVIPAGAMGQRTPPMSRYNSQKDSRTFVILGAGAAGHAAAEKLRTVGYQGRLVMITKEQDLPYDRPTLSKGYLSGDADRDSLFFRTATFYRHADIEVWLGREVSQVDAPAKSLSFADGESLSFDALLLATGGVPRKLEVPGAHLDNVIPLRSLADADHLAQAAAKASRLAVVGASFIGMETAASLRKKGLEVTVIGPGSIPFERQLGKEIGAMLQKLHEENGVSFRMGKRVARLEGDGRVQAVVLSDGEKIPADLVVAGIGVEPATRFLQGVPLNADGSVTVDAHLSLGHGLYAAGDMARFPDWRTGDLVRIEHWQVAALQGFVAAQNMAGQKVEFTGVPYFWTEHFEPYLFYVGHVQEWDEIIWHGDVNARKFIAFYVKQNQVLAAAGMEYDHGMAYIAELMRRGDMPTPEQLRAPAADLFQHLEP